MGGQFGDLGEQHLDAHGDIGHVQRAHAGRVDDPAPARHRMQRPRGGGVPPLGVRFADLACGLGIAARQRVQQRRFAHSGRTHQRDRPPRSAPGCQHRGRIGRLGVQRHDLQPALQGAGAVDPVRRVVDLVDLGQHDHRVRPGLVRQGQIAFQARRVEIVVARRDHEQRVHVGGDQLAGIRPLGPAAQQGAAVQQAGHHARVALGQHPVAHRIVCGRGMQRQVQPDLARPGFGHQPRPVHRGDAHGHQPRIVIGDLIGKEGPPAQIVQRACHAICMIGPRARCKRFIPATRRR